MFSGSSKSRKSLAHTPRTGPLNRPPRTPFSAHSTTRTSTSALRTGQSGVNVSATPASVSKQLNLSGIAQPSPFASAASARKSPFVASRIGTSSPAKYGGSGNNDKSIIGTANTTAPAVTPARGSLLPTTPATNKALARTSLSKYVMSSPAVSAALQTASFTPHVTDAMDTGKENDPATTGGEGATAATTPGPGLVGGRSRQVVHENDRHLIARYGTVPRDVQDLLPGLAKEQQDPSAPCARMGAGFAWLVNADMAYIWPVRSKTPYCSVFRFHGANRTTSKLHARLVCVTAALDVEGTAPPALLCTPEGVLSYISNLNSQDPLEISLPIASDDRVRLVEPSVPTGFVVVTEKAQLYHIIIGDDDNSISFRHLQKATGVLAGLSRIFGGSGGSAGGEASRHLSVVCRHTSRDTCEVIVLTDETIEKWDLSNTYDKFIFEHKLSESIGPLLEESSYQMELEAAELDGGAPGPRPILALSPLGVRHIGSHGMLLLLVATVQTNIPADYITTVRYTFVEVDARSNPPTITEGVTLAYEPDYETNLESELIHATQFLVPGRGPFAITSWAQKIITSGVPDDDRDIDHISLLEQPGEAVLALGEIGYRGLILSATQGILSVTDSSSGSGDGDEDLDQSFEDVSHYPVYQTPAAPSGSRGDGSSGTNLLRAGQLPADVPALELLTNAFRMYCTQQRQASLVLGAELVIGDRDFDYDSVLELSTELLNVRPASNPHWAESMEGPSSASSLILQHQLEDKRQKHFLLVEFLQEIDMWDLLTPRARDMVAHHGEKIAAAIALRSYQNVSAETGSEASTLQHMAMDLALRAAGEGTENDAGLSLQDLFFSEVASIDRILPFSIEAERQRLGSNPSQDERLAVVRDTNEIFQVVMVAAIQHRVLNHAVYATAEQTHNKTSSEASVSTLWTANEATQQSLRFQLQTTESLLSELSDVQIRNGLFDQLHVLCELFLSVYFDALNDNTTADEVANFNSLRTSVLQIFISNDQYEHAVALAERFKDFYSLVRLCETHGDKDRIKQFMATFRDDGFPRELYQYYHESGKLVDLVRQDEDYWSELSAFLEDKPELAWIHHLRSQSFTRASGVLSSLGSSESNSTMNKKTLLSLSKLSALAAGKTVEDVAPLSDQLFVVYAQEYLGQVQPGDDAVPRSADDLVQMLIRGRNDQLALQDTERFFFAVEIFERSVSSRTPEGNQALLVNLWLAAVASKDWNGVATAISTNAPDHVIQSEIEESVVMALAGNAKGSARLTPEIATAIIEQTPAATKSLLHRVLYMAMNAGQQA